MAEPLVLALDCSTTAAKAVVHDAHGTAVSSASRPIAMSRPHPGWHEQDPADWERAALDAMREAIDGVDDPGRVEAVCITHQRETFVCLDDRFEPLRPAILWVDTRAAEQIARLGSDVVARLSGKPADVTPALYELAWLAEHEPAVLRDAAHVGDVQAYLCQRLTGRWATGTGSADALGLFDLARLSWADSLLTMAAVRRHQLPDLVAAGELLAMLDPAVATGLGLPGPVPLVAGTGDGQAAGVGADAGGEGTAYLNLGTSMVMGVTSSRYVVSPAFRTLAGVVPGSYVLETLLNSAGYLTEWFRREVGPDGAAVGAHADLEAAAARVPPGCDGLLTLPYWNAVQSPYWDPLARGATVGWHGGHTRAHLYRSLLEGVAFELRLHVEGLERETGTPLRVIHAVGGGTRSAVWTQILADVTGRRIDLVPGDEVSARGAAIIARAHTTGVGSAGIPALAHVMAARGHAVHPDPATAAVYERRYPVYRMLYPALRDVLAANAAAGTAPGPVDADRG